MNLYKKWLMDGKTDNWTRANELEIQRYSKIPASVNQELWGVLRYIARCEWLIPKITYKKED